MNYENIVRMQTTNGSESICQTIDSDGNVYYEIIDSYVLS